MTGEATECIQQAPRHTRQRNIDLTAASNNICICSHTFLNSEDKRNCMFFGKWRPATPSHIAALGIAPIAGTFRRQLVHIVVPTGSDRDHTRKRPASSYAYAQTSPAEPHPYGPSWRPIIDYNECPARRARCVRARLSRPAPLSSSPARQATPLSLAIRTSLWPARRASTH